MGNPVKLLVVAALLGVLAICRADEALVKVKTGEIVVVKPDGATWSRMETNGVFYCVKRIKDTSLKYATDPTPVIVYPYAMYSNRVVKARTNRVLSVRSAYKIDPKAADKTALAKGGPGFKTNLVVRATAIDEP